LSPPPPEKNREEGDERGRERVGERNLDAEAWM
jgi:hypothetical protein